VTRQSIATRFAATAAEFGSRVFLDDSAEACHGYAGSALTLTYNDLCSFMGTAIHQHADLPLPSADHHDGLTADLSRRTKEAIAPSSSR
jgi:hypothetical protein